MEDEVCVLGLGVLAQTLYTSLLDQMHMCKNVLESLLATLMNMPDKTKDGPKARKDLQDLKIREDLHRPPRKMSDETKTETEAR